VNEQARIAQMLFPHIEKTAQQLLAENPSRNLKEGAAVTRFAPSPTGFLHIGGVFTALAAERTAHTTGGKVILRIEDTDKKRQVEGGTALIKEGLQRFGIEFDEGAEADGSDKGDYGPYTQSHRATLYQTFAKDLVEKGLAYPCFCSEETISEIRAGQEAAGVTPGYWGEYTRCRDLTADQVQEKLDAGIPYVIRLRSPGKPGGRVKVRDVLRGEIEMEENFLDAVLLKQDGIPTYHFAHVVDDTLMGVTHVTRGEEWIASAPLHVQIFWLAGIKPPKYAHLCSVMKEENGSKRKLSKRKDPEADVRFFHQAGYPAPAVIEYLLTLLNSNFEDWRRQNKTAPCTEFPFQLKKMGLAGPLFDLQKLDSVSAEVISRMTAEEVYDRALQWAKENDPDFAALLEASPDYTRQILSIDRGGPKPRKDIGKWDELKQYVAYFFDALWDKQYDEVPLDKALQQQILEQYLTVMDAADDKDTWFGKMKDLCPALGLSPDVKAYKKDPDSFKGHVGDVSTCVRVALTGRRNTPDLHAIMALLGQDTCRARIRDYMNTL